MNQLSTRSLLHKRMSAFVDWIRTDDDKVDTIRAQAAEIRLRIRGQAEKDGLTVRSTPNSGSFEKKTGLRRHLQGDSDVEGQDVDLPFVVSPHDEDGKKIDELLNRFFRYADASYPKTPKKKTRSSVQLDFVGTKLRYDLVPMLAVPGDDEAQILLRANGEQRRTSVQKHIEFVTRRTGDSNLLKGRVKFNECVRLVKWWREFRQAHARVLEDVPSIVLDLMCAHAYDRVQVCVCSQPRSRRVSESPSRTSSRFLPRTRARSGRCWILSTPGTTSSPSGARLRSMSWGTGWKSPATSSIAW
jgi:hypothetical protein